MEENIITIRNRSIIDADVAFSDFMLVTESVLNERAAMEPGTYCKCTGKELEHVVLEAMKELCSNTPFRSEEIQLVSAQCFPDILMEKYYGVEVKSTKDNNWTSTGSSIVESTRDKNVENIYMLFGKLGGKPAEFRCRPYNECLYDIAVTHSPRYLINMELSENQTIFSKMGTTYDNFRKSADSIEQVKSYYREKARKANKKEMPWWLGTSAEESLEEYSAVNVGLWVDKGIYATTARNKELTAQIFILFPEVLHSNFDNAALWLCTRRSIINSHMRDTFTAGGQYTKVNGEKLDFPLPHIIGKLLESSCLIKNYLKNKSQIDIDIKEFRPELIGGGRYEKWLNEIDILVKDMKVSGTGKTIGQLGGIPIVDWILKECTLA